MRNAEFDAELGRVLREARVRAGLTIVDVAALSGQALSAYVIGKFERGGSAVPTRSLMMLADIYGLRTDVLLSPLRATAAWRVPGPSSRVVTLDLGALAGLTSPEAGPLVNWAAITRRQVNPAFDRDLDRMPFEVDSLATLLGLTVPDTAARLRHWNVLVN